MFTALDSAFAPLVAQVDKQKAKKKILTDRFKSKIFQVKNHLATSQLRGTFAKGCCPECTQNIRKSGHAKNCELGKGLKLITELFESLAD